MTRPGRFGVSAFALAAAALALTFGVFGFAGIAAAQDGESITVELVEENDSGLSGTATLTADGDQTVVVVEVPGAEEGTSGHMFDSTCDDHGGATVFHDFTPLDADGRSETVVDETFENLTTGDYWVHLHQPAVERGGGLVCGNVPEYSVPAVGGTTTTTTLTSAGVGTTAAGSETNLPLLAGIAVAIMFAAFWLQRRVRPVAPEASQAVD